MSGRLIQALLALAVAWGVTCGLGARVAVGAGGKPNVLFVLIDDMGYADLTCYGEKRVHTDNIDRLAAEGIRFTRFYVNSPICSPSRTALMTGQYPARWKITSYLASRAENRRRGMAQWLDPAAPTVARQLRAAGYATGHFGKWHMGGQRDVGDAPLIGEYGFDKSLTQFEGLGERVLPLLDAYDGMPAKRYALGSDKLGRGNITWAERSKVTGVFVRSAIDFMRDAARQGKPFYVNVWPDDVHSPFFPPKALRGDASKKALYLGVVQAADAQLGELFDFVRNDAVLRDNTLIVLASDNGPEPGAGSAGALRGHKGNLYEGGIREPLIVWSSRIPQNKRGSTNGRTILAEMDLAPSVLAITGTPAGQAAFDGLDMQKVLLGEAETTRDVPVMWVRPPDRPGPKNNWPDLAIRDGKWKLLVHRDGWRAELFDINADPAEKNNLVEKLPELVHRLADRVIAWDRSIPR